MTSLSFDDQHVPERDQADSSFAEAAPGRPPVDEAINRDAILAKAGETRVRDALYALFRPTMAKFVRRYASWAAEGGAWDLDDVWQETFLAFAGVVRAWPGAGDFVAYYYAVFPRRLAAAVRRLDGRQPWIRRDTPPEGAHDPAQAIETRALVMGYVATLPPIERQILAQHVWEELPLASIAANLGLSLSETEKRWRVIRRTARRRCAAGP